jgi:hypothetical protein
MTYTVEFEGNANLKVKDLTITGNTYLSNVVVDASPDLQSVTASGNTSTQSIQITSTEASLSKLTGAIQVAGGVGVQGNVHVGSNVFVSSNLEVGTANLFIDTVNSRVGVGTSEPTQSLDVTGNVQVGTSNLFVDTTTGRVGVGTTQPEANLHVIGNITTAGYLTHENMPRFSAYYPDNSNYIDLTAYSVIKMSATIFNVGSGYDTSTGYFTAPVDGYYAFHMQLYSSSTSTQKRFEIYFKENSSSTAVTYNLHQHAAGNSSGGHTLNVTTYAYNSICNIALFSFITKMAAGNQIAPVTSSAIRTYYYRNIISGHMISAA